MSVRLELKGAAELRRRLLAMDDSVSRGMLKPILEEAADVIVQAARQMAPKRSHALERGIRREHAKSGKGFAYVLIGLDPEVYYGRFHEYGLGTGSSSPPSERTRRRRANYEHIIQLKQSGFTTAGAPAGAYFVVRGGRIVSGGRTLSDYERHQMRHGKLSGGSRLSKTEYRSLKHYERHGFMQGMRRPNMKAQPFMRPAVEWRSPWAFRIITSRLRELIARLVESA